MNGKHGFGSKKDGKVLRRAAEGLLMLCLLGMLLTGCGASVAGTLPYAGPVIHDPAKLPGGLDLGGYPENGTDPIPPPESERQTDSRTAEETPEAVTEDRQTEEVPAVTSERDPEGTAEETMPTEPSAEETMPESPAEAPTEAPTEPMATKAPETDPPTEDPTEAPTEPPTEAPTEPPATKAPETDPPTEAPTEPPTDPPTEAPTDPPETEAPLEDIYRVWIGDSRMSGVRLYTDHDAVKDVFIDKVGEAYNWFRDSAVPELEKKIAAGGVTRVYINMGVNDCYVSHRYSPNTMASSYAETINRLVAAYPDVRFYFCSVGPCTGETYGPTTIAAFNAEIRRFNAEMKEKCLAGYVDSGEYLEKTGVQSNDGIHYDKATYQRWIDYVMDQTH